MTPKTLGLINNKGKVAPIKCVKNETPENFGTYDNCFVLLIVYSGSAVFCCDDREFVAEGPCFVCFDERNSVRILGKTDIKCDAVYFQPEFLNVNMSFALVHDSSFEQLALIHDMFLLRPFVDEKRHCFTISEEHVATLRRLFAYLCDELSGQKDWYWSCRSRSYFMEIIILLERVYGNFEQKLKKQQECEVQNVHLRAALEYMESHYHEDVNLEMLTRVSTMNHTTLTSIFKEELNATPMEYLWQYRIMVAKKHLEFTSLPVKDVALRCGFKTVQHFSRRFAEDTGLTPRAFRELSVEKRKKAF